MQISEAKYQDYVIYEVEWTLTSPRHYPCNSIKNMLSCTDH